MIVQWLIQVATGFAGWLASWFPPLTLPDWLTNPSSGIAGFLSGAAGLGAWIPWAVILTVAGFLVATYAVTFGIKLVLRIISHVPLLGGSG